MVGGRRHLRLNFALKVIQPFKTRRLRQISAYNISAVRDSKNSSIMTNIMFYYLSAVLWHVVYLKRQKTILVQATKQWNNYTPSMAKMLHMQKMQDGRV